MTSEQAKAAADLMATVWEGEFPATCQVLAAVKDDNRHYKPDAKSRTAWDLATHLATADVWFIGMANNHSTHHRGQLASYLRAMGSKVPPIYGDSADYPVQATA